MKKIEKKSKEEKYDEVIEMLRKVNNEFSSNLGVRYTNFLPMLQHLFEEYKSKGKTNDDAYSNMQTLVTQFNIFGGLLEKAFKEYKRGVRTSLETASDNNLGLKKDSYTFKELEYIFDVVNQTVVNWCSQETNPLKRSGESKKGKPVTFYRIDIIEFLKHNPQIKIVKPE